MQAERLRDQIYQLIRDDLKSGELSPGQRLVEVELAEKYGVSRTPVREALFQLTRAGFVESSERGYAAPSYSEADIRDRLEVKRTLEPALAAHVAANATAAQVRRMTRALEREAAAHAAGAYVAFVEANAAFRDEYYAACKNKLLARCALLLEHPFDAARLRIHREPANRKLSLEHESRALAAISAHDQDKAAAEARAWMDFLAAYYAEHPPGR